MQITVPHPAQKNFDAAMAAMKILSHGSLAAVLAAAPKRS